jgi:hypothetical protein
MRKAGKGRGDADDGPIEVDYSEGVKNTRKHRKFKSQRDFERWLDQNEGNVEVHGTRAADAFGAAPDSPAMKLFRAMSLKADKLEEAWRANKTKQNYDTWKVALREAEEQGRAAMREIARGDTVAADAVTEITMAKYQKLLNDGEWETMFEPNSFGLVEVRVQRTGQRRTYRIIDWPGAGQRSDVAQKVDKIADAIAALSGRMDAHEAHVVGKIKDPTVADMYATEKRAQ